MSCSTCLSEKPISEFNSAMATMPWAAACVFCEKSARKKPKWDRAGWFACQTCEAFFPPGAGKLAENSERARRCMNCSSHGSWAVERAAPGWPEALEALPEMQAKARRRLPIGRCDCPGKTLRRQPIVRGRLCEDSQLAARARKKSARGGLDQGGRGRGGRLIWRVFGRFSQPTPLTRQRRSPLLAWAQSGAVVGAMASICAGAVA